MSRFVVGRRWTAFESAALAEPGEAPEERTELAGQRADTRPIAPPGELSVEVRAEVADAERRPVFRRERTTRGAPERAAGVVSARRGEIFGTRPAEVEGGELV